MRILLTGATGYIGGAIARAARAAGHTVLALSRHAHRYGRLEALGATPVAGDLRDAASLARAAHDADAVIHAAYTQTADGPDADTAAVEALVAALRGSGRPLVYTSGIWVLGPTGDAPVDEDSPLAPTPLIAWRESLETRLRDAARDEIRAVIVRPAIVYGRAAGIPSMLVREALETGRVRVVGDGRQEWPMIHLDDLAALYVRALAAPAGSVYNAVAGPSYPMRDLAIAASIAAGRVPQIVEWPLEEARAAMGALADALALHQRVSGRRAERDLGWHPAAPSPIEELIAGSYGLDP